MNDSGSKTILYLINGLGVASKDSYDIKFNDLMPNLSMLMRNYLYSNLENKSYNYNNAFRNFSLGSNLLPTYNKLTNDENFQNNSAINNLAIDVLNNNTKVQIFCFLNNAEVINQLLKIINTLKSKGEFKIIINIVLRQKDPREYDLIMKNIKQIEDRITLIKNTSIGVVVGERKINSDKFYELMIKGIGERWPDYNRKLNYTKTMNVKPRELDPFYVNTGFNIVQNDISLFMNYEDIDCNDFISKITNVKLYTLFPMKQYNYAINIYEDIPPENYFDKTLVENNLKCLILTTNNRIENINYNLCGLNNKKSDNIEYYDINDKSLSITDLIQKPYDYIIFDYDIGIFKEINEIKEFLMELDEQIDEIYKICDQNNFNFIISSLYGLYREYIIGVDRNVKLDYSLEIPAVIIAQDFPASKFSIKYGDSNGLSNSIFNLITKNENIATLFKKKSLFSLFKE